MAVKIDKYTCPFCGKKSIFVGVHDDEGNYKGRPGCEYESDPWSGLCYAIHHDGWGECILCTDAHDLPLGGCFFDTAEEAFQAIPTLTQPNEPLTLEELKEMDGEPVFLKTGEVAIREQLIAEWEILTEHDDSCFYFTRRKRGFHIKDYGKTWIAYRRLPEGEA